MKQTIKLWDYAGQILEGTGKGALLTTKAGDKVNAMTIGWGTLGIEWGKPVFIAFVRESRYTKALLDQNPEFTVNIPYGSYDKSILSLCGTRSGRDIDKISTLGLTLEDPEKISVPGIRQLPLTLECKVVYKQDQDPAAMNPEIDSHYPKTPEFPNGDYHTAYYGEVVAAYVIE